LRTARRGHGEDLKVLFATRLLEKAIVEPNQAGSVSTPDDDVSRTFDGMDEEDGGGTTNL
jgi:hypothetical protein